MSQEINTKKIYIINLSSSQKSKIKKVSNRVANVDFIRWLSLSPLVIIVWNHKSGSISTTVYKKAFEG